MIIKFIKVLTESGYITLNRMNIVSIDPTEQGCQIVIIPRPYSEEPVRVESTEAYEKVLEHYFAG